MRLIHWYKMAWDCYRGWSYCGDDTKWAFSGYEIKCFLVSLKKHFFCLTLTNNALFFKLPDAYSPSLAPLAMFDVIKRVFPFPVRLSKSIQRWTRSGGGGGGNATTNYTHTDNNWNERTSMLRFQSIVCNIAEIKPIWFCPGMWIVDYRSACRRTSTLKRRLPLLVSLTLSVRVCVCVSQLLRNQRKDLGYCFVYIKFHCDFQCVSFNQRNDCF